jgi:hypothetical protein
VDSENPTSDSEVAKSEDSSDKQDCSLVLLEVNNFTSSTASDEWQSLNKQTAEIKGQVLQIECSVNWKDQGWGNRKGKVMVALMRKDKEIAFENIFTSSAPHALT